MTEDTVVGETALTLEEEIAELERRKLQIKEQIEALMIEIADESGRAALKRRKYDVGYAPNDWSDGEEV